MIKKNIKQKTLISVNQSMIGEPLQTKIERIVINKEPIKDGAPLIYTERKDGVLPGCDIRTDRFEIAIDAMDKVTKAKIAKREAREIEQLNKLNQMKVEGTGDESKA